MFKFAAPAVAALGLVALAAQTQADVREPTGMGWHLSHEGATAKLAYGLANSDQLAIMMLCDPGQRHAVIYGDVAPASPRLIRTSSSGEIDPLSGGLIEESRIGLNDPAMRRLAREGRLAVTSEDGRQELRATGEDRRVVADFMAYCRGGQATA